MLLHLLIIIVQHGSMTILDSVLHLHDTILSTKIKTCNSYSSNNNKVSAGEVLDIVIDDKRKICLQTPVRSRNQTTDAEYKKHCFQEKQPFFKSFSLKL